MDGQTDRQKGNGRKEGRNEESVDGKTDRQTEGRTGGIKNRWADRQKEKGREE
jgi:hypothetical protein